MGKREGVRLAAPAHRFPLAVLASLCAAEWDAVEVLRRLLRRPTIVPRVS